MLPNRATHHIHYLMEENNFFCYCLQAFITEEILKRHIKDCFKANVKQRIKMPEKVNTLNSRSSKEKQNRHLWFTQILKALYCLKIMECKIRQQNSSKYQKHVACSYGYKRILYRHMVRKLKAFYYWYYCNIILDYLKKTVHNLFIIVT